MINKCLWNVVITKKNFKLIIMIDFQTDLIARFLEETRYIDIRKILNKNE